MAGATKLTDRGVAALKPGPSGRQEYFDTEVRGLFLRVSGDSKVWGWRYRSPTGSGQPRMRIGHYVSPEQAKDNPDALTVAGARAKARRLRSLVDEGRDPAAEAKGAKDAVKAQPLRTVADLADSYLSACERGRYRPRKKVKRATTLAGERWLWSKHWAAHIGGVRIEALTRSAITKRLDALADEGKGVTANRARALLRQLYAYAISQERVATNPVAGIEAPVEETPRATVLDKDQATALWRALKDTTGMRKPLPGGKSEALTVSRPVRIVLQLALLTLQRRGEITAMQDADVDLEQGVFIVPAHVAKNGKPNIVPLSPTAIALIREAMSLRPEPDENGKVSPWVFPGRNAPLEAPIRPAAVSHAMRDLRAAIGADEITTHDLRRSAASWLGDAGLSAWEIGLLLNHSGETDGAAKVTTSVYVKSRYMEQRRRVIATLERVVLEMVGERDPEAKVVSINGGAAL